MALTTYPRVVVIRGREDRLARKKVCEIEKLRFFLRNVLLLLLQKLEAIMSRTRKTPAKASSPANSEGASTPEPQNNDSNSSSPTRTKEEARNIQNKFLSDQGEEHLVIKNENGKLTAQIKPDIVEDADRAVTQQQLLSQSSHVINGSSRIPDLRYCVISFAPFSSL